MKLDKKERRPSKKFQRKENKKFPYKHGKKKQVVKK